MLNGIFVWRIAEADCIIRMANQGILRTLPRILQLLDIGKIPQEELLGHQDAAEDLTRDRAGARSAERGTGYATLE